MLRSFSVYFLTNGVVTAISFFLLPFLSRYIAPADYGALSLLTVMVTLMVPFVGMSANGAIEVEYHKRTREEMGDYIVSCLFAIVGLLLISVVLSAVFASTVSEWLTLPVVIVVLVPFFAFAQAASNVVLSYFQTSTDVKSYARHSIGVAVMGAMTTVLFILAFDMGWEGRLFAIYLSHCLLLLVSFRIIRHRGYVGGRVRAQHIRDVLKFGIPLIPHIVSGASLNLSDRFFIGSMIGKEEVGLYSMAYSIAALIPLITTSMNSVLAPYLFKNLQNITERRKETVVLRIAAIGAFYQLLPFLVLAITPLLIGTVIDERYAECSKYVLLLGFGYSFLGLYLLVTNFLFFTKRTGTLTFATLITALVNLALNYILIGLYGAMGAAYATALSNFVFFLVTFWLAQRAFPMPWGHPVRMLCLLLPTAYRRR